MKKMCSFIVLFLLSGLCFSQSPELAGQSPMLTFIARLHPLLVHLPIGSLVLLYLLEIFSHFKRFSSLKPAATFTLFFAVATAIISVVTGYLLSQQGGYGKSTVLLHQWMAILVAATALFALIIKLLQKRGSPKLIKVYAYLLGANASLLLVAGHFGGTLTHGANYLSNALPPSLQSFIDIDSNRETKVENSETGFFYADRIQPVFEAKCIGCHNLDKQKAKLDLSTAQSLLTGGKSGPAIVAFDPESSLVVQRISLPVKQDGHMPPEGKDQLTKEEIEIIEWWIGQGALVEIKSMDFESKTVDETEIEKTKQPSILENPVALGDSVVISLLRLQNVLIQPVSQQGNYLQVQISKSDSTSSILQKLLPLAQQITWLDLGHTDVNDSDVVIIEKFKDLTRLHLEKTKITNSALKSLSNLKHLEYLNLYGTAISDSGLFYLDGLDNLESLYLWQTKVTDDGVAQLRTRKPNIDINYGADIISPGAS